MIQVLPGLPSAEVERAAITQGLGAVLAASHDS